MNKQSAGKHTQPRQPAKKAPSTERTGAGSVLSETAHRHKPSGPVTYVLEKGANVWPGRK